MMKTPNKVLDDHARSFLVGGFNPFENYYIVKMGISSPNRGENKKYLKQ